MFRIRFFIILFLFTFVSCQSVAGELIIYKIVSPEHIQNTSPDYESLKEAYKYFDYDGGLDGLLINKVHKFIIPSNEIKSAYVEDVWFKPEGELIFQVALKIDSEVLKRLNSYLGDTKIVALVIGDRVFTTSYVEGPIDFVDNMLIVSVIGRNKSEIRKDLLPVVEDVTIR